MFSETIELDGEPIARFALEQADGEQAGPTGNAPA
jgi:hypothetical protein